MRPVTLFALLAFGGTAAAADPVDFRTQIYPILHDRCFRCHQGMDAKAGVRLDTRTAVLAQVKPGRSAESLLLKLASGDDPDRIMPPRGERLTAKQVTLLRDWIDQGVSWDEALLPPDSAKANHWAFRPVVRPSVPVPKDVSWIRNPVDAFVAAKHAEKGLKPAPEADRRVLLRRLTFDLTGLPPTVEELDGFLRDDRPDAYDRTVERLLASPAYGERWGRHWLDVARYADSEGYESDHVRPFAWRYRDYVVKAFNDDKPFDRFVTEQLAGDELTPYSDENLIATGFLAAARLSGNEENRARQVNDQAVDIANATAATFLGLTMQCAQCHAHKYEAITHQDYYRFQGFFLKGMPNNLALKDPAGWIAHELLKPKDYDSIRKEVQSMLAAAKAKLNAAARTKLTIIEAEAYDTPTHLRSPAQQVVAIEAEYKFQHAGGQIENAVEDKKRYGELKKKLTAMDAKVFHPPQTWGFYSPATSPHKVDVLPMKGFYPPTYDVAVLKNARPFVLLAGDVHRRGEALNAGWPAVFGPTPKSEQPRTTLAKWLTDPQHPLTARVYVNRVWHYHFGRGLVETGGDFGVRGSPPSHPELLDWLAAEFVKPAKSGAAWSTKHLHRLIVTSATYRQSSKADAASLNRDPDGRLLTRWRPRRLEAEAVRDLMLAVSGDRDLKVGGKPELEEDKNLRRAIYQLQKRQRPPAVQTLFDGPTGATESCPIRVESETPLSALYLMNHPFPLARAKSFAARVRAIAGDDSAKQVDVAFRLSLARLPLPAERTAVEEFLNKLDGEKDNLASICHLLFCTTEFLTME